jgi:PHP family Zn ribbon phosphoesterase
LNRVEELADRPTGFRPQRAPEYYSLVPLQEIIADALSVKSGKKVNALYEELIQNFNNEFAVLLNAPKSKIAGINPAVAEGIRRVRVRRLHIKPGYDGQYGKIRIYTPKERTAYLSKKQTAPL